MISRGAPKADSPSTCTVPISTAELSAAVPIQCAHLSLLLETCHMLQTWTPHSHGATLYFWDRESWVDLCLFDKLWQNYPSEVFLSLYGLSEAEHLAQKALQTLEHGKGQNGVFPVNVNLSAQSINNCCGLNPRTFVNST